MANKVFKSERIASILGLVLCALAIFFAFLARDTEVQGFDEMIVIIGCSAAFISMLNLIFFILSFFKKNSPTFINTFGIITFSFSIPLSIISCVFFIQVVTYQYSDINLESLFMMLASVCNAIAYAFWLKRKTYSLAQAKAIREQNRKDKLAKIENFKASGAVKNPARKGLETASGIISIFMCALLLVLSIVDLVNIGNIPSWFPVDTTWYTIYSVAWLILSTVGILMGILALSSKYNKNGEPVNTNGFFIILSVIFGLKFIFMLLTINDASALGIIEFIFCLLALTLCITTCCIKRFKDDAKTEVKATEIKAVKSAPVSAPKQAPLQAKANPVQETAPETDRLKLIKQLKDEGLITQEEYKKMMLDYLDKM